MKKLEGKVVLITGAARGIGAEAARIFVAEGARVVLTDVLAEPLTLLTQDLGPAATCCVTDVTSDTGVRDLINGIVREHGRIDIAVLNAGISGDHKPIEEYPTEMFEKVMSVNVRSVWLGLKYLMQAMDSKGGSIVITGSAAGIRATPKRAAYIASKHAVIGLMKAAAIEGAGRGIRVNSVNPATIDTPMVRDLEVVRGSATSTGIPVSYSIPLGRQGTAEEVARMMLYLASDESSFCTGGVFMVDGGASAGRSF